MVAPMVEMGGEDGAKAVSSKTTSVNYIAVPLRTSHHVALMGPNRKRHTLTAWTFPSYHAECIAMWRFKSPFHAQITLLTIVRAKRVTRCLHAEAAASISSAQFQSAAGRSLGFSVVRTSLRRHNLPHSRCRDAINPSRSASHPSVGPILNAYRFGSQSQLPMSAQWCGICSSMAVRPVEACDT